ncbi:ATP-binding cassette domain-containing protein [bacterium]|jgi:putative ABC transport system ATP-binding protein|nr:ATP-binding cassette domain-containing protein [bacterium]
MSLDIRNFEINPPGSGETKPLLEIQMLELEEGTLYQLTGSSGSGKSLFLQALSGLIPHEGTVSFKGMDRSNFTEYWWRTMVSYVGPIPVLFSGSIKDNILISFSLDSNKTQTRPLEEELRELMNRIGLERWDLNANASKLSHGEKMRVQLLRHLVLSPEWLLLDESLANLDEENASRVLEMLERETMQRQMSLIIAQHNPLSTQNHLLCIMNGTIRGPLSPN